jgi:hypothetical protein
MLLEQKLKIWKIAYLNRKEDPAAHNSPKEDSRAHKSSERSGSNNR